MSRETKLEECVHDLRAALVDCLGYLERMSQPGVCQRARAALSKCESLLGTPNTIPISTPAAAEMRAPIPAIQVSQSPMKNAIWSHHFNSGVLVIIDEGTSARSVTNDAERVLESLRAELGAAKFDRLPAVIYQDSMGDFDGMLYDPVRRDASFYPLRATTEAEAVAAALARDEGTIYSGSAAA